MEIFWCDISPWQQDLSTYRAYCTTNHIPLDAYLQVRDSIPHIVGQAMIRQLWPHERGPYPGLTVSLQGKPRFAAGGPPYFNLSHAGQLVVLAAGDQPLGIDVEETIAPAPALLDAVRPEERSFLQSLPPEQRTPAFFRIWTRKESILKARGDGLGSFFDLEPVVSEQGLWRACVHGWFLQEVSLIPAYIAAVSSAEQEAVSLREVPLPCLSSFPH